MDKHQADNQRAISIVINLLESLKRMNERIRKKEEKSKSIAIVLKK